MIRCLKTDLLLAVLVSFGLLQSCKPAQGISLPIPEPDKKSDEPVTFTVVSATTWNEGDKIVIQDHTNAIQAQLDPSSISEDGKTATVTVKGLNPSGGYDGHYHAMFPAQNWDSVQGDMYYYLYFATSNAPNAIAFDRDKTFNFKSICRGISFSVSTEYDTYQFRGTFGEEIEYESFQVKQKYDDGGKYELTELLSGNKKIEGTLDQDGNTVYILNGTKFTRGYEILVGKSGNYTMKASFPNSITLGSNIDLGDITSQLTSCETPADTVSKDPYLPVMGSYKKMNVNVEEISGLCLSEDKSFLWAVGDQGLLSKVSFDGTATQVWTHDADMEDVTLDPQTGNLYIAVEGSQKVYQVNKPAFTSYKTIFYVQEAIDGGFDNSGLEGLSYYKDGLVFVGAQEDATLWLYQLDGKKVWKKRLTQITSKIDEIGGLCYDPQTDHLWVTDSNVHKLFVFDAQCTKLIASYSIPYIENAESVCVDHANNCVWVGSDEDSPKLYKISFTNL